MKKLLLSAVLAVTILSSSAQKIICDKIDNDGCRTILTSYSILYAKLPHGANIAMSKTILPDSTITYYISLEFREGLITIDENRKLLLKLDNTQVIELSNVNKIGSNDHKSIVSQYGTFHYSYPIYAVSEENIEKIIDGEIRKIRIETDLNELDREISGNKFSKAVSKCFKLLKAQGQQPKTIYDGF